MRSGFYDTFMQYVIERDEEAHKFSIFNAHKDMCYLANMATSAGADDEIAAATGQCTADRCRIPAAAAGSFKIEPP